MMQDDDKLELDDLDDVILDDEDFDLDDEDFADLDLEDLDADDLEPESDDSNDLSVDDLADDDWEDEEFSDVEESAGQQGAQANKTLIYAILAVFGCIFLFVGWKAVSPMLSGGSGENSAVVDVAQQDAQSADVVAEEAPPMPVPVANVAAEDDVVAVAVETSQGQDVPALTPLPTLDDMRGGDDLPSLPVLDASDSRETLLASGSSSNDPEIVLDLPTSAAVSDVKMQQEAQQMPVVRDVLPKESDSVAPVASSVAPSVSDEDLDKIREASAIVEGKVEGIEGRLDRYDDTLSQIMASLKRIEGELKVQKEEVEAVKKAAVSAAAVKSAPKKKQTPPKKVVKKKDPILYDSKPATPKKTVRKKASPPKSWVLKSAQPGKAVVAEVGTRYLRSVEVGTTLSGVGRITSISNQSGRWIVQGTQGRITQ